MATIAELSTRSKIKDLDELAVLLTSLRASGKIVVHCHGVFDLLHIGHIRYFEQAKTRGDILVVTITPDEYVNKGPHRPAFTQQLRAEAIAALACVDFVAINRWPTAAEALQLLKPNFYVKGPDYKDASKDHTGGILKEEEAVKAAGGQLVFTDDITFSSTNLINRAFSVFPKETQEYLHALTKRYNPEDIFKYLKNAGNLKVLVVGETIIDEYFYCETLGKSGKEPVLAAKHKSTEKFAGGILAVANHLASFTGEVGLLTFIGRDDSQEAFIRSHLKSNVNPMFLVMEEAPTIVKRRFVETYPLQKLFETYTMEEELTSEDSRILREKLIEILPAYDLVIVTDYGHVMMNAGAIEILCSQAKFLAINTQVNAGNHGFNTVSKYPRADFVCISEKELRLEARNQRGVIRDIVEKVAEKLTCDRMLITRGQQGCLCYGKSEGFFSVPAFTGKVVDRVGAGDALFAISSLCMAQGMPIEVVGFVANAVGSQAVGIMGNKTSVEKVALTKYIESLMK